MHFQLSLAAALCVEVKVESQARVASASKRGVSRWKGVLYSQEGRRSSQEGHRNNHLLAWDNVVGVRRMWYPGYHTVPYGRCVRRVSLASQQLLLF